MSERLNAYYCPRCEDYIVTRDVDEGVTPMFLACRVKGDPSDPANDCQGTSSSMGYPRLPWPPGAPEPVPTWEWYKPDAAELATLDDGMRDHVERGGLALRQLARLGAGQA